MPRKTIEKGKILKYCVDHFYFIDTIKKKYLRETYIWFLVLMAYELFRLFIVKSTLEKNGII